VIAISVAVVAGVVYLAIKVLPDAFANTKDLNAVERSEERGRVRSALVPLIAGLVAAIGAYFTARTFQLSRRGQNTDRFSRAVEQLGHEHVDVRLGGVFGLEQLARDSRPYSARILEVLTAHVREHFPSDAAPDGVTPTAGRRRAEVEVQAVVDVISRKHWGDEGHRVDLGVSDLAAVRAKGLDLTRARLWRARLREAVLPDVVAAEANLIEADLSGAVLVRANLRGSALNSAVLRGTNLAHAKHDDNTCWEGAIYDKSTVWPTDDFNPDQVGAVQMTDSDSTQGAP
jgi:hypothetical protein